MRNVLSGCMTDVDTLRMGHVGLCEEYSNLIQERDAVSRSAACCTWRRPQNEDTETCSMMDVESARKTNAESTPPRRMSRCAA